MRHLPRLSIRSWDKLPISAVRLAKFGDNIVRQASHFNEKRWKTCVVLRVGSTPEISLSFISNRSKVISNPISVGSEEPRWFSFSKISLSCVSLPMEEGNRPVMRLWDKPSFANCSMCPNSDGSGPVIKFCSSVSTFKLLSFPSNRLSFPMSVFPIREICVSVVNVARLRGSSPDIWLWSNCCNRRSVSSGDPSFQQIHTSSAKTMDQQNYLYLLDTSQSTNLQRKSARNGIIFKVDGFKTRQQKDFRGNRTAQSI